jgi:hypothetical protein
LPTDIVSFIWGFVIAVLAIIGSGLLKAASADLYKWLKGKINPPPVEPVLVERDYEPESKGDKSFSWVNEEKVLRKESEGYSFYIHPKAKAKCYRLVRSGNGNQFKEWLMGK